MALGAHYSTPSTGSVVLYVSEGDRFLTRGQPTDLLLLPSNQLPFSPLFARLHLFCFIYLLIRITAMADRRLGSETTPWNTLGSRVTRETKTYYFTVGGIIQSTIIRHGYTQWMQKTKPRDISVGWHWKRDPKKKKNYSSVIRKWVSPLLSYIIHV